jgi:predicted dehydrogenase
LITPADVEYVYSKSMIPWWASPKESINFNYALSGGTMMAMGTYNYASLRMIFDAEPEECISCDVNAFTDGPQKNCDTDFTAKFRFPNGGIGEARSTLKGETIMKPSYVIVTNKEVVVPDEKLPSPQVKVVKRTLTLNGLIHGIFWHRIDVKDDFEIRNKETGKVVKKWTEEKSHKVYTFKEAGGEFADLPGEIHWMSYRYQLEAFVNKIEGRKVQHWVTGEDSIKQMKMIDMAYEKSGLGMRPTSTFK